MENTPATHNPNTPLPPDALAALIGHAVHLTFRDARHDATLAGYLKGTNLIITRPAELEISAGQTLNVQIVAHSRPHEFKAMVRHVASEPFPHLFLDCPDELTPARDRRHARRAKINITGFTTTATGKSSPCTVSEISIGGATIVVDDHVSAVNDRQTLTLNVVINGVQYTLSLDSEIRSIRHHAPINGKTFAVQGLSFENLSEQDVMALAAFDLLPNWNG
jgi:PilZ domain/Flagellar protein YcgR